MNIVDFETKDADDDTTSPEEQMPQIADAFLNSVVYQMNRPVQIRDHVKILQIMQSLEIAIKIMRVGAE